MSVNDGTEGTGAESRKFDPAKLERLEGAHRHERERPRELVALAGLDEGAVVLDLGAGTGFFARVFLAEVPRSRVLACDQSPEMLRHLAETEAPRWGERLEIHGCEEIRVPLDDAVADCVFWANLYHELHDPRASLAEARRLLRPGGKIMIVDWKAEETPHGPKAPHRVPVETVMQDLAAGGFVEVEEHGLLAQHHVVTARRGAD